MTSDQKRRLQALREQWIQMSAVRDTSSWDFTFFFRLLDEKEGEILQLRQLVNLLRAQEGQKVSVADVPALGENAKHCPLCLAPLFPVGKGSRSTGS